MDVLEFEIQEGNHIFNSIDIVNNYKPMEEIKTSEGFLVLKVSNYELSKATGTQYAICDNCCFDPDYGYYVAVLNSWLCPECYADWKKTATRYSEDIPVEERNYQRYKELINGNN